MRKGITTMGSRTNWLLYALTFMTLAAFGQQREYRDPQSFPFNEAVPEPAAVIVTQRSTNGYGNHPRGTNDPLFVAQELLGRPTATAVTINVASVEDVEAYFEYGSEPGEYSGRTASIQFPAGESKHALIDGLEPNTRYYYRMRYMEPATSYFKARAEHSFHTQRPPGSTFTYVVQFDPHMLETNDPEAYKLSLNKMLADNPDFMLDLGDTFFIDRYTREGPVTEAQITGRVQLMRSYFDIVNHSVPLFLVNGNHEGEWGRHLDGTATNLAVLGTLARCGKVNARKNLRLLTPTELVEFASSQLRD